MIANPTFRRVVIGAAMAVAFAAMVHTFVAMGWLRPVLVHGSSMASTYHGEHRLIECEECRSRIAVDALATIDRCPACRSVMIDVSTPRQGDRLPAVRRSPTDGIQRWESVVLQSPEDARTLLIKRVLGLPGEHVGFVDGDLWINQQRVVKSPRDQLVMRVPLSRFGPIQLREGQTWTSGPVTDDLEWNAGVTRRLNEVSDIMVEWVVDPAASSQWRVEITGRCALRFRGEDLAELLDADGNVLYEVSPGGGNPWTLSSFDRSVLLMAGGHTVFQTPLEAVEDDSEATVQIEAIRGEVTFEELSLWRDVYYETPAGPARRQGDWRLKENEWFVVGDNQAVSRDSRHWAPRAGVPGRLIVGKPWP